MYVHETGNLLTVIFLRCAMYVLRCCTSGMLHIIMQEASCSMHSSYCNILQHTVSLQHTATHCVTKKATCSMHSSSWNTLKYTSADAATSCNTQIHLNREIFCCQSHSGTHRNTLQHTTTCSMHSSYHYTLQHTATCSMHSSCCNTLQHTATHCNTLRPAQCTHPAL